VTEDFELIDGYYRLLVARELIDRLLAAGRERPGGGVHPPTD
jgi:hypothetical protein